MKTFQEFLFEARRDTGLRGLRHGLASSKSDAISRGLRFFKPEDGKIREIRNYGSQSKPGGNVRNYETMVAQRARRRERMHDVTPPDYQNHQAFAKKSIQATRRGMDLHHMTPIHVSAKIKASMSDDEWQQRLKDDEAKGVYHGNHPRNLALTKRMGEKGPGISHSQTIHTPRRGKLTWKEISAMAKDARQKKKKRAIERGTYKPLLTKAPEQVPETE